MISARSNSARPPKTVSISRPCAVVVSAQASASDLKPAPTFATVSRMLSRSRVDRASRQSNWKLLIIYTRTGGCFKKRPLTIGYL